MAIGHHVIMRGDNSLKSQPDEPPLLLPNSVAETLALREKLRRNIEVSQQQRQMMDTWPQNTENIDTHDIFKPGISYEKENAMTRHYQARR
jgi:hypothetical protein